MELSEIYERLCTLGIPVAYLSFCTPQRLPFMVYYESGTDIRGADGLSLIRETEITVELYAGKKSPELERRIEALFRDRGIRKDADVHLSGEEMLMTAFSFNTIIKAGGNDNVTHTD